MGSNLLEKLKERQATQGKGISDYKFADILGISPQLWQMTRTGKRAIGIVMLKAALKTYPELAQDILLFLSDDVVNPSALDYHSTGQAGGKGG